MYLNERNMVANTSPKYANSTSNYCVVIIMVHNLNFFRKLEFFGIPKALNKCLVKVNNRFAVVVYAKHVVKRPSKRSAKVNLKSINDVDVNQNKKY